MQKVEIKVKGHIDKSWSDWLEGLDIIHTNRGDTLIKGSIPDQSVLIGLVNRLASLGMQLISVTSPEANTPNRY